MYLTLFAKAHYPKHNNSISDACKSRQKYSAGIAKATNGFQWLMRRNLPKVQNNALAANAVRV